MKKDINTTTQTDSLFIPSRNENVDFPVTAYFSDLSHMYSGVVRWHWHEEIEIIIINSGHCNIMVDNVTIPMKAGQGIMVNQNVLHSIRPVNNEQCTFYSLIFLPIFLFGYSATYFSSLYLTPILSSSDLKYITLEESVSWQEELIEHLNNAIAANLTRKFGYELITKAELCLFWSGILEHYANEKTSSQNSISETSLDSMRVKQALLYIENHHMEPITLVEIADSIHVSKSECCRCFKRTLHMTPIEYVMRYRIFEATRKIKRGDEEAKSMSSLAMSVGFNNASYFNKLFKKYLGCTPSQYKVLLKQPSSAYDAKGPLHIPSPFKENF
ncbi:MAG: AraC family transcriptional regulator [Lachnospiraceae bacterium]|nr:AraC family transcriptional regulator [Lachnospiraceae bacterium]